MKSPNALLALKPHQTKDPLQLHDISDLPWALTVADVFELGENNHLVLADSYFGLFEVDQLPNMTRATIITRLKRHFATHGAPQQLMTDNGAYFKQGVPRICQHMTLLLCNQQPPLPPVK